MRCSLLQHRMNLYLYVVGRRVGHVRVSIHGTGVGSSMQTPTIKYLLELLRKNTSKVHILLSLQTIVASTSIQNVPGC